MRKPIKKLDGRSKEARALRAKGGRAEVVAGKRKPGAATKADWRKAFREPRKPVSRILKAAEDVRKGHVKAVTPRANAARATSTTEVSFGRETSLRILSLQIASNNIGRDTATRDLVPLARQIEEFLNGAPSLNAAIAEDKAVVMGVGSLAGYAVMSADALDREVAAQTAESYRTAAAQQKSAVLVVDTLHDAEHAFD